MAEINVTTTGTLATVPLLDLGVILNHPITVDLIGTSELEMAEIMNSKDLQDAIDAFYVNVTNEDGDNIRDIGLDRITSKLEKINTPEPEGATFVSAFDGQSSWELYLSTTGTDVTLGDIPISLTHPQTSDIAAEFNISIIDVLQSEELQEAIISGDALLTDGDNNTISITQFESLLKQISDWDTVSEVTTDAGGNTQFRVLSELSVGSITKPRELVAGEGDSVQDNILVYTYNGSTYTDVTTDIKTDGNFVTFTNNATENFIYVSYDEQVDGDYFKFCGLKVGVESVTDTPPINDYISYEYWNGSSWTTLNYMVTQASGNYYTFRYSNFDDPTSSSYQVRFAIDFIDSWVKNDPISSGTDRFWIRIKEDRSSGDPTSRPEFDYIKCHTNRAEINGDGYIEYFGTARPRKTLPWHLGLLRPANQSPANADIYMSDNLAFGATENAYQSGANDKSGSTFFFPYDYDKSSPIKIRIYYRTTGTDTGDFDCELYAALGIVGESLIYDSTAAAPSTAPNEVTIPITITPNGVANALQYVEINITIPNANPLPSNDIPDVVFLSFRRYGNSDPNFDDLQLASVAIEYYSWCEGGHRIN